MGAVEVGVYFGGAHRAVTKQFLHLTYACAALQQVGGKAVTQGVGADGFGDTCGHGCTLYDVEHRHARELPASLVEKQIILRGGIGRGGAARDIESDLAHGLFTHGNNTFLVAFADNLYELLIEVNVAKVQRG